MKRKLFGITFVFVLILIIMTVVLSETSENALSDNGEYIVAANEIEQLIKMGEADKAAEKTAILREKLSSSDKTAYDNNSYIYIMCGICGIFLFSVFGYIYYAVLRPFDKLSEFADSIAKGDFDIPLNYERSDYFGKFTWAFDCMRCEIKNARACEKESIENNKTVIAELSHDIRTPIASIRAYAEGIEAGMASDPEKMAKYLGVIMKKCDEVKSLTDDMLIHSVSDMERLEIRKEKIALAKFIKNIVSEYDTRLKINLDLPDDELYINGDRNRTVQVFGNIIGNTIKYAGTDIDISLNKKSDCAEISFRDYGKGIPDEELPFIFEKFYRGTETKGENGAGLGLYIVKYVMTRYGGEVFAENLSDGFVVRLLIPLITS